MKRIIRRVQHLGQKANELREAMEKLPPKVAEIRQAFTMTAGQLHQLREDVQSSVAELKTDNEDDLTAALDEINGGVEVFRQAGYELSGVDMDLSRQQRLIVHLDKVAEVRDSTLRGLIEANRGRRHIHALLQAMGRAEDMAGKVNLTNLAYRGLAVQVGPVPSVRLRWRAEEVFEEEVEERWTAVDKPPPMPASVDDSLLGRGSFFGKRTEAPPLPAQVESLAANEPPAVAVSTVKSAPAKTVKGTDWKKDALERFKTMPNVSKYR